jgi:capsular polysaccharide export protein
MLAESRGVVLVNSTVGLYALRANKPTKALGVAIYDMPGLTDQQPLDTFWTQPQPPDPALVDAFVRALARATQLKGSFYNVSGMEAAAAEIVARVLAGVGATDWFETPPPRLARARAIGVPVPETLCRRQEAVEPATRLW